MEARIAFVVLYVRDLDASRRFYETTLGLPVKQTDEGYVEFGTAGAPLALMSLEGARTLTGAAIAEAAPEARRFALSLGEVPNVDETYARLKNGGVAFVRPPQSQPWGQRTAHLVDPDGNLLEVFTWERRE